MFVKLELSRISRINFNLIGGISVLYFATNISIKTGNFFSGIRRLGCCFSPIINICSNATYKRKLTEFLGAITNFNKNTWFLNNSASISRNNSNGGFASQKYGVVSNPVGIKVIFKFKTSFQIFSSHLNHPF